MSGVEVDPGDEVLEAEVMLPAPMFAPAVVGDAQMLWEQTKDYIDRSLAASTRRAFTYSINDFLAWCVQYGQTALPCERDTLAMYTTTCVQRQWKPKYIQRHWTAIRSWHRALGHGGRPDLYAARKVLATWVRELDAMRWKPKVAPAFTIDDLHAMAGLRPSGTLRDLRDRTVLILTTASYGRRSEVACLDIGDVTFTDEGMVIDFWRTKTGRIEKVYPYGAHLLTCPVRTVRSYIACLGSYGITDGPLLRRLWRSGRPNERAGLTGESVGNLLHELAVQADIPNAELVTGHSARASGATISYESGMPEHWIAVHGGWDPGSAHMRRYFRVRDRWAQSPIAGVGF